MHYNYFKMAASDHVGSGALYSVGEFQPSSSRKFGTWHETNFMSKVYKGGPCSECLVHQKHCIKGSAWMSECPTSWRFNLKQNEHKMLLLYAVLYNHPT